MRKGTPHLYKFIFKEKLKLNIEDGDYDFYNVYNADGTGLYRKVLPSKSYWIYWLKAAEGF